MICEKAHSGAICFWHDVALSFRRRKMAIATGFPVQLTRYFLQAGLVFFAALPSILGLIVFLVTL